MGFCHELITQFLGFVIIRKLMLLFFACIPSFSQLSLTALREFVLIDFSGDVRLGSIFA